MFMVALPALASGPFSVSKKKLSLVQYVAETDYSCLKKGSLKG